MGVVEEVSRCSIYLIPVVVEVKVKVKVMSRTYKGSSRMEHLRGESFIQNSKVRKEEEVSQGENRA